MVRPYNPEETVKIAIEALGLTEEQLKKPLKIVKNDRFSKNPPNFLVGSASFFSSFTEKISEEKLKI